MSGDRHLGYLGAGAVSKSVFGGTIFKWSQLGLFSKWFPHRYWPAHPNAD